MKPFVILILIFAFAAAAAAQSGRMKPAETPTPNRRLRPSISFDPSPLPTPKPADPKVTDDEIVKVDSTLVPIPVSVVDSRGHAVRDLRLADFKLTIDGKPAQAAELARTETPIRLAMLFDNSSSVIVAREFEKRAAVRFFRQVLRPDRDMAALFSVADFTRLEQPLTRDISLLTTAIDTFPEPRGATALLDGIIEVAQYLRGVEGRRVIVIVSDGEDTYSELTTTLEGVLKWLQITNCQVYVVKTKDFENFKRTGMRGGNANIRTLAAERRMLELATQTGGAVYSPITETELDEAFRRISAELAEQYILSYYPDDDAARPGDFRAIDVVVKDRAVADIRARKGYYVPKK